MRATYEYYASMRTKQVVITLKNEAQAKTLKRQARKWAKELEEAAGVHITQPVSAYVRHLIEMDGRKRK